MPVAERLGGGPIHGHGPPWARSQYLRSKLRLTPVTSPRCLGVLPPLCSRARRAPALQLEPSCQWALLPVAASLSAPTTLLPPGRAVPVTDPRYHSLSGSGPGRRAFNCDFNVASDSESLGAPILFFKSQVEVSNRPEGESGQCAFTGECEVVTAAAYFGEPGVAAQLA